MIDFVELHARQARIRASIKANIQRAMARQFSIALLAVNAGQVEQAARQPSDVAL